MNKVILEGGIHGKTDKREAAPSVERKERPQIFIDKSKFTHLTRLLIEAVNLKVDVNLGELPIFFLRTAGDTFMPLQVESIVRNNVILRYVDENKRTITAETIYFCYYTSGNGNGLYTIKSSSLDTFTTELNSRLEPIREEHLREGQRRFSSNVGGRKERVPSPDGAEPFAYDVKKAQEYGMAELRITPHLLAQELLSKLLVHDSQFVTVYKAGAQDPVYPNRTLSKDMFVCKEDAIILYWKTHCRDLPPIPQESMGYFFRLSNNLVLDTIDNDSPIEFTRVHTPVFDNSIFLLVTDFPGFNCTSEEEKELASQHPSMTIFEKLFGKRDPTNISRAEINLSLWANHDKRIPSQKARRITAELLGVSVHNDRILDNYEFRLMRHDEYIRATKNTGYDQNILYTHLDGYRLSSDGHTRLGLLGEGTDLHNNSCITSEYRNVAGDDICVRLVLARKQ